jgi:hypothetical protein
MQHGCMERLNRKRGPEVWQFRWSGTGPEGKRLYHKRIVGTVERYPDENAAGRSVVGLVSEINTPARSTNSGASKWTMKLRHQFFLLDSGLPTIQEQLGVSPHGRLVGTYLGNREHFRIAPGLPRNWHHAPEMFLASSLRRSETAQEKISRASQHFLSHRGIR